MKLSFFILVCLFLFSGCGDKEGKKIQKEGKKVQNAAPTRKPTPLSLEDQYWQKICGAFREAQTCVASHSTTTNSTNGVLNCILELNKHLEVYIRHELNLAGKPEVRDKLANKLKEKNLGQSPDKCVKDGGAKILTYDINKPCQVTGTWTCMTETEKEKYAKVYSCMFSEEGSFTEKMTAGGC